MRKDLSKPPTEGSTGKSRRLSVRGGDVRAPFLAVAMCAAACVASRTVAEETELTSRQGGTDLQDTTFSDGVVKMTEEQFEEFLRQRAPFLDLPWFRCSQEVTNITEKQLRAAHREMRQAPHPYMLFVELPDRLAGFYGGNILVDFDKHRALVPRLIEALPHFPETKILHLENFTGRPELPALLRKTRDLPILYAICFQEGSLSQDEVAILAQYASVRYLGLRCQVSPASFAELATMDGLEELSVSGDKTITPDCFVTLAKLPHFRHFYFGDTDPSAFSAPISEETRRAIESLDGRLEEFIAEEIPTTIHVSIVRALLKVKSLKKLVIDTVGPGLTLADVEQLGNLPNLTRLDFNIPPNNPGMGKEEEAKARTILCKIHMCINKKHRALRNAKD